VLLILQGRGVIPAQAGIQYALALMWNAIAVACLDVR
jgi:hypothetical protein